MALRFLQLLLVLAVILISYFNKDDMWLLWIAIGVLTVYSFAIIPWVQKRPPRRVDKWSAIVLSCIAAAALLAAVIKAL